MANSTLAPWAELAPGVDRLLTDDDLLRINAGDVLDGLDVLPGFTYPVRRLFS